MAIDLSTYPPEVAAAVEAAAPGWADGAVEGDDFGEGHGDVWDAVEAAVRQPGMKDDEVRRIVRLHMVRLNGIGSHSFAIDEWLGDGRLTRDWRTLGDYDREEWAYQQKAKSSQFLGVEMSDAEVPPYRGYLGMDASCVVDGRPWSMSLETVHSHLMWKIESRFSAILKNIAPHSIAMRRVAVPLGDGEATQIHMSVQADGREPLVRHLRRRQSLRIAEFRQAARDTLDVGAGIWILQERTDRDGHTLVFSGPDAIDAVRLRHFLEDVRTMEKPAPELERVEASLMKEACLAWKNEVAGMVASVESGDLALMDAVRSAGR